MRSTDTPRYPELPGKLPKHPKTWLITSVAGIIGNILLRHFLKLNESTLNRVHV